MSTEMIAVRLTSEQKQRLEQLASQRNATISDVIRSWIDKDSEINGISSELMSRIKAEAQRRKQTESRIIEQALNYAFNTLRDGPFHRW